MPGDSDLLKEMEIWLGLYEFYFDLTLRANLIFYGIAGAVATFVLGREPILLFALLFPAILGFILAIISIRGASQFERLQARLSKIAKEISPTIQPDVWPLRGTLLWTGIASLIVSLILLFLPFGVYFNLVKLGFE